MSDSHLKQRLVAILAADAAGYSRLMAGDDRATVAALDTARAVFRRQIEANQGRVIDMAGDSVLAVFETATGAVAAALAIQQEIGASVEAVPEDRRLRFRIGVHLGDVIEKADGTVYGDGVNIAARLEGLAEPGGIILSDMVHGAVRDRIKATFEDAGEHNVKNIPRAVRAYRVLGEAAVPRHCASAAVAKPSLAGGEIDLSLLDKPSIAVLPFANMSGDPEQDYFADGLVEDIITTLSKISGLSRHRPKLQLHLQGPRSRRTPGGARARRALCVGRRRAQKRQPHPDYRPADRCGNRRTCLGRTL